MATLTAEIELPAHLIPEVLALIGQFALTAYLSRAGAIGPANAPESTPLISVLIDPCARPSDRD
jgi:hypothetical protein